MSAAESVTRRSFLVGGIKTAAAVAAVVATSRTTATAAPIDDGSLDYFGGGRRRHCYWRNGRRVCRWVYYGVDDVSLE